MTAGDFDARLTRFLDGHAPRRDQTQPRGTPTIEEARTFQRALFDHGLAGITWPAEYGGAGLTPEAQQRFAAAAADYVLPTSDLTIGLNVCAPAILQFGDTQQKTRHLAATLRGDHIWCQLWSEPEAGSDLAGVRTTAIANRDGWTVSGQKIWTSGAQFADFGLLLCRTDPEASKHRGLSMLIVDLDQPGVTVRPLRQMTGESHFNEVFLDDVVAPSNAVLGGLGHGWTIATWMMGRERVSVGLGMRNANTMAWADVADVARTRGRDHDPAVRHRLAELHVRQRAAELLSARLDQEAGAGIPQPLLGSAVKIVEAAVIRDNAEAAVDIAGDDAISWDPDTADGGRLATTVLMSPAFAIGGGTDEIQLNTLAERFLGLPRD